MQFSNARWFEPQQFRINAHPTRDQLKACYDILFFIRSRTSGSSLVSPTLTLVRAILLQATVAPFKYNSAFRIFMIIRELWAPCFVISIGKVHISMSHNAADFLWTRNLQILIKKIKLKSTEAPKGHPLRKNVNFVLQMGVCFSKMRICFSKMGVCFTKMRVCFWKREFVLRKWGLVFFKNGSLFYENGSLFYENGSLFCENGGLFCENGSLFCENGSLFFENVSLFCRKWEGFFDDENYWQAKHDS